MTAVKRYKTLYDDTAAGTGPWIACDVRYDKQLIRALQIYVTSGDTITIQGITKDTRGNDKSFLNNLTTADISTLKSYTATDNDDLEGPWTYIRVVKTGTNGQGKVQGMV